MIQRLVGFCLIVGLSVAGPLFKKGAFAPAPPGTRPPCATKGMTFCEEVDKYPTKLIQKLLLQSKAFDSLDFFVDESEGLDEPPEYVLHQEMTQATTDEHKDRKIRSLIDTDFGEGELSKKCSLPAKIVSPKMATNSRGEWRYIAQEKTFFGFRQQVRMQECDKKEECQKSCRQFFASVSMEYLDHDGKRVDDIFWIPSSCRCFDESDNVI